MNRRLFLGQTVAGAALHLLPFALAARPAGVDPTVIPSETERIRYATTEAIRNGLIGNLQQVYITHLYSPEQTSKASLLTLARRDFAQAEQLIGLTLRIDEKLLFTDSPSAAFGSYSTRFSRAGVTIVWQGLARIGRQASAPTAKLRLYGSEGMLQTTADRQGYQVLDLRGRVIKSESIAM